MNPSEEKDLNKVNPQNNINPDIPAIGSIITPDNTTGQPQLPEKPNNFSNQPTSQSDPAFKTSPTPNPNIPSIQSTPLAGPGPVMPVPHSKKKRFILIGLGITAAILLIVSGVVFGYYLPNKPENVWKKALSNTSLGYDKLVEYGKQENILKSGKITGDFKYDSGGVVGDGNIEGKYDENDMEFKLDTGALGQRFNINVLTHAADSKSNPDIYIKVNGLTGVDKILSSGGQADLGNQFAAFENQW
jgi:hypothetical protein